MVLFYSIDAAPSTVTVKGMWAGPAPNYHHHHYYYRPHSLLFSTSVSLTHLISAPCISCQNSSTFFFNFCFFFISKLQLLLSGPSILLSFKFGGFASSIFNHLSFSFFDSCNYFFYLLSLSIYLVSFFLS